MDHAVSLSQLQFFAGTQQRLNITDWQVPHGSRLALLGNNGAGKSTLLALLAGLYPESCGVLNVLGGSPYFNPALRANIGYLSATPALQSELTVKQQLQWTAQLYRRPKTTVESILEQHQLQAVAQQRCGQLSTGYRQRVGLAQALLHQPSLLLLDEPARGLDLQQIQTFYSLLQALPTTTTLIIATHQPSDVMAVCNQLAVIRSGAITLQGARDRLAPDEAALQQLFFTQVLQPLSTPV